MIGRGENELHWVSNVEWLAGGVIGVTLVVGEGIFDLNEIYDVVDKMAQVIAVVQQLSLLLRMFAQEYKQAELITVGEWFRLRNLHTASL